jgi:hypothetical protein
VPFALLATAYRRKRIMEGLISGDREVMAQVRMLLLPLLLLHRLGSE